MQRNLSNITLPKIDIHNRRTQIIVAVVIVFLVFAVIYLFSSSDDSEDLGSGFKKSKTTATRITVPSKKPKIDQPCSLITKSAAGELLGAEVKDGVNADLNENTLRCRFDAVTTDGKFLLNINVYVFEDQKSYDALKAGNNGVEIETNVDDGFYAVRKNDIEIERIVAVRSKNTRIAVSASMATISPKDKLLEDNLAIPDSNAIAVSVGNLMAKVK